jgi:hypothetical protein
MGLPFEKYPSRMTSTPLTLIGVLDLLITQEEVSPSKTLNESFSSFFSKLRLIAPS